MHRGESYYGVLTYFLCVLSVFLYFFSITHLNGKLFISCMLYLLYPSVIVCIVFIVNKQTTSIPRTFEKLATPLIRRASYQQSSTDDALMV